MACQYFYTRLNVIILQVCREMIISTLGHLISDQSVDFETFSRSTKYYYSFGYFRCDHGPLSVAIAYFSRSSTLDLSVDLWVVYESIKVVVVVVEIDQHNQPQLRVLSFTLVEWKSCD